MDWYVFQKINYFAGKSVFLDRIAVFFAEYFGYILAAILLLLFIKNWKKYWQMAVLALARQLFQGS